ncbi:MAG: hypothetical protein GY868_16580, partial [Deltaproteobacteria bacterium]|nr:hypothetical protein [Deltaproteobacteria bacterium]
IVSGLVIAVQDVLMVPYMKVAARYHEAGCFTPLFYLLFKGLGLECAFSQNTIFVQTPREVVSLVTTWEKLGLYFAVVYGAGALVLISLWQSSRSCFEKFVAVVKLLIVLLLYIVARYVALAVMVVDFGRVELFWEPWMVACSWLPLVFLLAKAVPGGVQRQVGLLQICCNRKNMYAGAAAGIFCLSLVGYGWFPDPGAEKQGRILIDEYYSDWEWTERPLDTRWYGIQSVYNYHNMGEYLRYFFEVDTLKQPVSDEVLERCDVFMVKTPTRAFSRKEIDAIVAFARRGGGVFLIGDHTNVFGTTININPLAHEFGIRFNYDATYNLRTNDLHYHEPNSLFQQPAVLHMPYFLFATSCSIQAPLFAEDVMTASNLKTIYLDYSRGGYFPDK